MEKVTIALLGLGTVGSGVVDILKTQREKLKKMLCEVGINY